MKDITVKDIINICQGKLICGDENIICNEFKKDTRTIKNGDVYVGIKGENFDGNTLYEKAFENGAEVCIISGIKAKEYKGKTIIEVKDTINALQKIAEYKRKLYDIPVIAVTGSVGKTSTKDIIASVMSQKYKVLKTEGNMNNHIGLPMTISKLKDQTPCKLAFRVPGWSGGMKVSYRCCGRAGEAAVTGEGLAMGTDFADQTDRAGEHCWQLLQQRGPHHRRQQ